MPQYDENGYLIPTDNAWNFNSFKANNAGGFSGQSFSPDYADAFGKYVPTQNYGMSVAPIGSDISNIGVGSSSGGMFEGLGKYFGGKNVDGSVNPNYGGMALGVAQGLGSMYMGMKQYGLAKDQLKQGKEQFNKNYAAQRTTTNSALEDRQRARVASNGSAYESVGNYMNKNRIN